MSVSQISAAGNISPPRVITDPVLSGGVGVNATVGQTLTSTSGTWRGTQQLVFAYQWYRGGSTPIPGATGTSYTLTASEQGLNVDCGVTANGPVPPASTRYSSNYYTVSAAIPSRTGQGVFAFGFAVTPASTYYNIYNTLNNAGVIAINATQASATTRHYAAGSRYGGDKGIAAFGLASSPTLYLNKSNLISNTGVLAADTPTSTGQFRGGCAGATYGSSGQALIGYGTGPAGYYRDWNYITNTGVVEANAPSVFGDQYQAYVSAAEYGSDKVIFAYGISDNPSLNTYSNEKTLVSNTGVLNPYLVGGGSRRYQTAGAGYGGDKAIFAYGSNLSIAAPASKYLNVYNLVSAIGDIAANAGNAGMPRQGVGAATYGSPTADRAVFAYGYGSPSPTGATPTLAYRNIKNMVTNTGVLAADDPSAVGTARSGVTGVGF